MSNTGKWLVGIIVVVVIVGGIWWWSMMGGQQSGPSALNTYGTQTSTQAAAPAATNTDDSDQSIAQDMTSANAQMNGFDSDSASINQGLNDQPVQQESF